MVLNRVTRMLVVFAIPRAFAFLCGLICMAVPRVRRLRMPVLGVPMLEALAIRKLVGQVMMMGVPMRMVCIYHRMLMAHRDPKMMVMQQEVQRDQALLHQVTGYRNRCC